MKRKFLGTNEVAIFSQPAHMDGPNSSTVHGPCEDIETAWMRASAGYDMCHITKVVRLDEETWTGENVTDEVADALAYLFASEGTPIENAPSFVDPVEVEMFSAGMRREFMGMRRQGVA